MRISDWSSDVCSSDLPCSQLLLFLGVDLGKGYIVVLGGGFVENRCKIPAWSAPWRPKIHNQRLAFLYGRLKSVFVQIDGAHKNPYIKKRLGQPLVLF